MNLKQNRQKQKRASRNYRRHLKTVRISRIKTVNWKIKKEKRKKRKMRRKRKKRKIYNQISNKMLMEIQNSNRKSTIKYSIQSLGNSTNLSEIFTPKINANSSYPCAPHITQSNKINSKSN